MSDQIMNMATTAATLIWDATVQGQRVEAWGYLLWMVWGVVLLVGALPVLRKGRALWNDRSEHGGRPTEGEGTAWIVVAALMALTGSIVAVTCAQAALTHFLAPQSMAVACLLGLFQ